MNERILIGSGYFDDGTGWASWFCENIWLDRVLKLLVPEGRDLRIISVGDSKSPMAHWGCVTNFDGNPRHVHALLGKQEPRAHHKLCGWSSTLVTLAMMAYTNMSDLLFIEADCLAFGPFIERMYAELGDGGMIFGGSSIMPCAQSLILIRHSFIPQFVVEYLTGADERRLSDLPETRFRKMQQRNPGMVRQFSFGCDRERPLPVDDEVWYAQKLTRDELLMLRERGLLDFDPEGMPEVQTFTGRS